MDYKNILEGTRPFFQGLLPSAGALPNPLQFKQPTHSQTQSSTEQQQIGGSGGPSGTPVAVTGDTNSTTNSNRGRPLENHGQSGPMTDRLFTHYTQPLPQSSVSSHHQQLPRLHHQEGEAPIRSKFATEGLGAALISQWYAGNEPHSLTPTPSLPSYGMSSSSSRPSGSVDVNVSSSGRSSTSNSSSSAVVNKPIVALTNVNVTSTIPSATVKGSTVVGVVRKESPLDLSVKTVRQSADSSTSSLIIESHHNHGPTDPTASLVNGAWALGGTGHPMAKDKKERPSSNHPLPSPLQSSNSRQQSPSSSSPLARVQTQQAIVIPSPPPRTPSSSSLPLSAPTPGGVSSTGNAPQQQPGQGSQPTQQQQQGLYNYYQERMRTVPPQKPFPTSLQPHPNQVIHPSVPPTSTPSPAVPTVQPYPAPSSNGLGPAYHPPSSSTHPYHQYPYHGSHYQHPQQHHYYQPQHHQYPTSIPPPLPPSSASVPPQPQTSTGSTKPQVPPSSSSSYSQSAVVTSTPTPTPTYSYSQQNSQSQRFYHPAASLQQQQHYSSPLPSSHVPPVPPSSSQVIHHGYHHSAGYGGHQSNPSLFVPPTYHHYSPHLAYAPYAPPQQQQPQQQQHHIPQAQPRTLPSFEPPYSSGRGPTPSPLQIPSRTPVSLSTPPSGHNVPPGGVKTSPSAKDSNSRPLGSSPHPSNSSSKAKTTTNNNSQRPVLNMLRNSVENRLSEKGQGQTQGKEKWQISTHQTWTFHGRKIPLPVPNSSLSAATASDSNTSSTLMNDQGLGDKNSETSLNGTSQANVRTKAEKKQLFPYLLGLQGHEKPRSGPPTSIFDFNEDEDGKIDKAPPTPSKKAVRPRSPTKASISSSSVSLSGEPQISDSNNDPSSVPPSSSTVAPAVVEDSFWAACDSFLDDLQSNPTAITSKRGGLWKNIKSSKKAAKATTSAEASATATSAPGTATTPGKEDEKTKPLQVPKVSRGARLRKHSSDEDSDFQVEEKSSAEEEDDEDGSSSGSDAESYHTSDSDASFKSDSSLRRGKRSSGRSSSKRKRVIDSENEEEDDDEKGRSKKKRRRKDETSSDRSDSDVGSSSRNKKRGRRGGRVTRRGKRESSGGRRTRRKLRDQSDDDPALSSFSKSDDDEDSMSDLNSSDSSQSFHSDSEGGNNRRGGNKGRNRRLRKSGSGKKGQRHQRRKRGKDESDDEDEFQPRGDVGKMKRRKRKLPKRGCAPIKGHGRLKDISGESANEEEVARGSSGEEWIMRDDLTKRKRKIVFGDGSDFKRPGWQEELIDFKRKLRMPQQLIRVSQPSSLTSLENKDKPKPIEEKVEKVAPTPKSKEKEKPTKSKAKVTPSTPTPKDKEPLDEEESLDKPTIDKAVQRMKAAANDALTTSKKKGRGRGKKKPADECVRDRDLPVLSPQVPVTPMDEKEGNENIPDTVPQPLPQAVVTPTRKGIRRNKFKSGFDYIRKKKKTVTNPEGAVAPITPRKAKIPIEKPLTLDDVQAEIRGWVLNKGHGETALHRAARLNYADVAAYCLENELCPPNCKDNAGYTPLHETCIKGNLEVARILLTYGADPSTSAPGGVRPLHEACDNGHEEMVRLLISYGADPTLTTYAGQSPLELAQPHPLVHQLVSQHLNDVFGLAEKPWEFKGSGNWSEDQSQLGYDATADIPEEEHGPDASDFEFEASEIQLPPLYKLKERQPYFVLLNDVLNYLGVAKEKFFKTHTSAEKEKVELNSNDFLEEATCCHILGERFNLNSSSDPLTLIKYDDRVKKMLNIESCFIK